MDGGWMDWRIDRQTDRQTLVKITGRRRDGWMEGRMIL
jgi:hypothetical protein